MQITTEKANKGHADVIFLKEKVINEVIKVLNLLEKGHRPNYETILEEMSLIKLVDDATIDADDAIFYLDFYLNNKINING